MSANNVPLINQVGGHAGVMASEDGSLLIKAALPAEHAFYENISGSPFEPLRPFVPKFYGTLKLQGQVNEDGQGELKEVEGAQKESLVLENLSYRFTKPNILDIKLGTVLYDQGASPDKVERMLKTARETTSLETGVRLTGFQVYDNATGVAVNTPKAYGKSIKVADLPDGMARFFPLASSGKGLPAKLLIRILTDIIEDVEEIREAIKSIEMRMVGGSLLFIYEGDLEKAEEAVKRLEAGEPEAEEEAEDDEDETEKLGLAYTVKLIDFAHTRLATGEGPDEGVLKGLDTVLSLLKGRLEQVKATDE